jgi:hypothetical protein
VVTKIEQIPLIVNVSPESSGSSKIYYLSHHSSYNETHWIIKTKKKARGGNSPS